MEGKRRGVGLAGISCLVGKRELDPVTYNSDSWCRLLVNRRSAVRRRCDWSLPVCILEQSNLCCGVVF